MDETIRAYKPQRLKGGFLTNQFVSITNKGDVLIDDNMLETEREKALGAIILRLNACRLIKNNKIIPANIEVSEPKKFIVVGSISLIPGIKICGIKLSKIVPLAIIKLEDINPNP